MMRSYAMTFAALTLRAELGILIFWFGLPLIEAYRVSTWSSWVVNLLFVEWALLASARPKTDATRRRAPTGDTGGESVLNGKIKPQTSMGQRPRPVWR
jgi:hypothetical protein